MTSKYDQPETSFHPYPRPDDVGYAGWVNSATGALLGWRKLDGSLLTVQQAGGESTGDYGDNNPDRDGADWWKQ